MNQNAVIIERSGRAVVTDESLYYSIQEVSEKLSIPIQKLRRWDTDGVLKAQRSLGGHRRYLKEMIDRLAAQIPESRQGHQGTGDDQEVAGRERPHHPVAARKRASLSRSRRDLARPRVDDRSAGPLYLSQQRGAGHFRPAATRPLRTLLLRFRGRQCAYRQPPLSCHAQTRRRSQKLRDARRHRARRRPLDRNQRAGAARRQPRHERYPRHGARYHRAAPGNAAHRASGDARHADRTAQSHRVA